MNERVYKTKQQKCKAILEEMYPSMQDFTAEEYRVFSKKLTERFSTEEAKQVITESYFKLHKFLNYAVEKFANSNLKIQLCEDYLSECHLSIITKLLAKAENGEWFNGQMSFRNTVMKYVDTFFNQFYIENTPTLIIKLSDNLIDRQATINNPTKLTKDQREISIVQLESLNENMADTNADLFGIAARGELKLKINAVLDKVTNPEHKEIIKMYFGLDDYPAMKMKEIAKAKGLKNDEVLHILGKVLKNIRHPKYARQLRDFLEV